MRHLSSQFRGKREGIFSPFWFGIVQTRLVLSLFVLIFSSIQEAPKRIFAVVAGYILLNIAFGFASQSTLQLKRIRILPAIVDVLFTSYLINLSGGQNSPWILLYIYPIVSVARYLSYEGSIPIAIFSILAYTTAVFTSLQTENSNEVPSPIDGYSLILRSLVLFGIGIVIGNLSRTKHNDRDNLVDIFKEIDKAILNGPKIEDVSQFILDKAVGFTGSDMGLMRIFRDNDASINTTAWRSGHEEKIPILDRLIERYSQKSLHSGKPIIVRLRKGKTTKNSHGLAKSDRENSNTFIEKTEDLSGSFLFVPLEVNDRIKGIIALYTKDKRHDYTQNDVIGLTNFALPLGVVLMTSRLSREFLASEDTKKERLKMLFEIGEQLKVEQEEHDLPDVFQKVVDLAYSRLASEESALFIWDDKKKLIEKVAARGPSPEITEELKIIEKPYKKGNSWIGKVFDEKKPKFQNDVTRVKYKTDYSKILPSKNIRHYIGVPLLIGDEVLGVIRVINKRAADYSIKNNNFSLSEEGFVAEDLELMQTLASQVVSAILSAKFLEIKRYYENLIENSPDPIIVLDEYGKIKVFNEACEKIWGYKAEEVIGRLVEDYYESGAHTAEIAKKMWNAPDHRIQDFEARIRTENEIIPISLSASLLFDKQGYHIGSIGVFKDLREIIKLQEEKNTADRLQSIGRLAHTVGHEIKHDIATALNYIDVLAFECDDRELRESYHDIQEPLREAVDKFQNMLMVGKARPLEKQIMGARDIFRGTEQRLKQRAKVEDVRYTITYPDEDYDLTADVEQLDQVLINLFNNSMDAIKKNKQLLKDSGGIGKIALSAKFDNGYLRITWKDNGCGISQQNVPKVFTPFITDKDTGNGLGLFIVKNIIENHNGEISLESVEGRGTLIHMTLPVLSGRISQ